MRIWSSLIEIERERERERERDYCFGYEKNSLMRNKKVSQLEIERIERRCDNMSIIENNDENFILINWNRERERERERESVCVCVITASIIKKNPLIEKERMITALVMEKIH